MRGFLLDTNVVSELTRDAPAPQVVEFLTSHDELRLPSIAVHELEYGLRLLPAGRRRDRLATEISRIVSLYRDRIVSLDAFGATWAARFRAEERRSGRTLDLGDALVAGIARANDLAVATRNVRDFRYLAIELVNPWESPWSTTGAGTRMDDLC